MSAMPTQEHLNREYSLLVVCHDLLRFQYRYGTILLNILFPSMSSSPDNCSSSQDHESLRWEEERSRTFPWTHGARLDSPDVNAALPKSICDGFRARYGNVIRLESGKYIGAMLSDESHRVSRAGLSGSDSASMLHKLIQLYAEGDFLPGPASHARVDHEISYLVKLKNKAAANDIERIDQLLMKMIAEWWQGRFHLAPSDIRQLNDSIKQFPKNLSRENRTSRIIDICSQYIEKSVQIARNVEAADL